MRRQYDSGGLDGGDAMRAGKKGDADREAMEPTPSICAYRVTTRATSGCSGNMALGLPGRGATDEKRGGKARP